jgi:DNA-binding XRE family transcriptional regulator
MSDLTRYIEARKTTDPAFAEGFDAGYADFKIGVMLRQAREKAGLTQEQVAQRLGTQKSAISRIENHADNVTLSTLKAYAQAVGRTLQLQLLAGSPAQ